MGILYNFFMFKWSDSDKIAIPIMLAIVIMLCVGFHFLLKNKSEKIKRIPLISIASLLIMLEVAKQLYFIIKGTYTANHIPAHFCSLIVIIIALAEFLPKKLSKYLDVPSIIFPIICALLILIHPKAMIGNSSSGIFASFPNFHAFMFHALVVAYPLLKLTLIRFELKLSYCFSLACCIVFYGCYAIPIAFAFNNNYVNILWSMFEPLEKFRQSCGQVLYDIVLFLIGVGASIGLYLIWYFIDKKTKQRRKLNES